MKIIERYFAAQFLTSFLWTITAFVFFYLVFDLFSRLNLIIDGTIPPGSVMNYYISMVPLVFVQICPLAALIATMYTFSNISRNNELIAAVACGKHPYSVFFTFLFLGLLISLSSIAVNERNVPEAARRAHNIRFRQMEDEAPQIWRNRVIYGSGNRRFFIEELDTHDNTFVNFEITKFSPEGAEILKFRAREGAYEDDRWVFKNIILRHFHDDGRLSKAVHAERAEADSAGWQIYSGARREGGEELQVFSQIDPQMEGVPETPADFTVYKLRYDEMDYAELKGYIERLKRAGFDPRVEIIALHSKLSLPFASLILMLIGISFAVKQKKGGVLIGFGTALGMALAYYLAMSIGHLLGEFLIHPAAGAWLANVLFFIPGFYFLIKARYISYR